MQKAVNNSKNDRLHYKIDISISNNNHYVEKWIVHLSQLNKVWREKEKCGGSSKEEINKNKTLFTYVYI